MNRKAKRILSFAMAVMLVISGTIMGGVPLSSVVNAEENVSSSVWEPNFIGATIEYGDEYVIGALDEQYGIQLADKGNSRMEIVNDALHIITNQNSEWQYKAINIQTGTGGGGSSYYANEGFKPVAGKEYVVTFEATVASGEGQVRVRGNNTGEWHSENLSADTIRNVEYTYKQTSTGGNLQIETGNTPREVALIIKNLKIEEVAAGQYLKVTGTAGNPYDGAQLSGTVLAGLGMTVDEGADYEISAKVYSKKAIEVVMQLVPKKADGKDYKWLKNLTLTPGEWATYSVKISEVTGDNAINWADYNSIDYLSFENKTLPYSEPYYLDDVKIVKILDGEETIIYESDFETGLSSFTGSGATVECTKIEDKAPITLQTKEEIGSFKDAITEKLGVNATAGVAIPNGALNNDTRMELVTMHYNSITAENEMKPDSFLNGAVPDENGKLRLNFTVADQLMKFVKDYNNSVENDEDKIRVRGHVLVWHSQTPDWFFREGYKSDGNYVDETTMLKRLEDYINDIIDHYENPDSDYKGIIYAWDVVNEQIEIADGVASSLRRYMTKDGKQIETGWYSVFKGKNDYITHAFKYANEALEKYPESDVKLFYNDYGETDANKSTAICDLIREIKNTNGARIDGMGMQGHYDMTSPSVKQLEDAVIKYADVVNEIQITELDLASSQNYDGTNKQEEYTKQGYRYKEIFEKIVELNRNNEKVNITSITMWGTHDGASWLNDRNDAGGGTDGTRKQCPLLFDDNFQAKPAYFGFVDPSRLDLFINMATALYFKNSFDIAESIDCGTFSFKTIWDESGLTVLVDVEDSTVNLTDDKVTIYIGEENNGSTIIEPFGTTREGSIGDEEGYQAKIIIPIEELKVNDILNFDVVVSDDGVSKSWNDLDNMQTERIDYYGKMVLKPYIEIKKGTVNIDNKVKDGVWNDVPEIPLTIKSGNPVAKATVKALWDENYLYVYATVIDPELDDISSQTHEQDSLEVFIDQNNAKSGSYDNDDSQYRINYKNEPSFNGPNCKVDNLISYTEITKTGYIIKAAFKWIGDAPKAGDPIGIDFQINDGSNGSRLGTLNWYDDTGAGWGNSAVFGTVKLSDVEAKDSSGGEPGEKPGTNTPSGSAEQPKDTTTNDVMGQLEKQTENGETVAVIDKKGETYDFSETKVTEKIKVVADEVVIKNITSEYDVVLEGKNVTVENASLEKDLQISGRNATLTDSVVKGDVLLSGALSEVKNTTVNGNFSVSGNKSVVENVTIKSDFVIGKELKNGEIRVSGTKISGRVTINGGGRNSIYFADTTANTVVINKKADAGTQSVRLVLEGKTTVKSLNLQSRAIIASKGNKGSIANLTVGKNADKSTVFLTKANSVTKYTLTKGAAIKVKPASGTLSLSSTNRKVAAVSKAGTMRAYQKGNAKVNITLNNKKAVAANVVVK